MYRIFATLIVCALFPLASFAGHSWPEVTPVEKDFQIDSISDAYVSFEVTGKNAEILYRFECATPNVASKRKIQFDYMGGFECRLWSPADETRSTLLIENSHDNDWQSRGRFAAYEVVGSCAEYPEFGRIRHFRLRGMLLTLTLNHIRLAPPTTTAKGKVGWEFVSFHLRVSVRSDPSAKSAICEPPNVMEPPTPDVPDEAEGAVLTRACRQVRSRRAPTRAMR